MENQNKKPVKQRTDGISLKNIWPKHPYSKVEENWVKKQELSLRFKS